MSSRSRARYRNGRGGGPSRRPAKGLFKDNIWHCDCNPRLPAEHFPVKKEGKNQGRWFYTCQQSKPERCNFFLWDEDAKPREEAAILGNSHAEPAPRAPQGNQAGISKSPTITAHPPRPATPVSLQPKRTAQVAGFYGHDEEEEQGWGVSSADECEFDKLAAIAELNTPSKTATTGLYPTPSVSGIAKRKLPWLEPDAFDLHKASSTVDTPSKPSTSDQTRLPHTLEVEHEAATDPHTHRPATRFRDALANPADASATLTVEALATLASINLPSEVLTNLRSVLSKHDLRTRGVIKGRDISRLALKAKDDKIASLEATIASLQNDKEIDRTIIRNLRWEQNHKREMNDD